MYVKDARIMKKILNFLNTLIVFVALLCFPIVLTITYRFDQETTNKLNEINTLFLKIDETNQKQIMFHKSEYSHYVLITSEEYTKALSDIIECYENCLNEMNISNEERQEHLKNLKIFKAAQQHRFEMLRDINKNYAKRMLQIKNLVEQEVQTDDKNIIKKDEPVQSEEMVNFTSELEHSQNKTFQPNK